MQNKQTSDIIEEFMNSLLLPDNLKQLCEEAKRRNLSDEEVSMFTRFKREIIERRHPYISKAIQLSRIVKAILIPNQIPSGGNDDISSYFSISDLEKMEDYTYFPGLFMSVFSCLKKLNNTEKRQQLMKFCDWDFISSKDSSYITFYIEELISFLSSSDNKDKTSVETTDNKSSKRRKKHKKKQNSYKEDENSKTSIIEHSEKKVEQIANSEHELNKEKAQDKTELPRVEEEQTETITKKVENDLNNWIDSFIIQLIQEMEAKLNQIFSVDDKTFFIQIGKLAAKSSFRKSFSHSIEELILQMNNFKNKDQQKDALLAQQQLQIELLKKELNQQKLRIDS